MNAKEFQVLNILSGSHKPQEDAWNQFPLVYGGGEFMIKCDTLNNDKDDQTKINDRQSFIVMQKLGRTLKYYFEQRQGKFSLKTVCQIGIQLLRILERLHEQGFVYNDLKLDNIIVGTGSSDTMHQIKLIDFGLVTRYLDSDGSHIKEEIRDNFMGNIALASPHNMTFKTPSRKDDLISLSYLLIYMI